MLHMVGILFQNMSYHNNRCCTYFGPDERPWRLLSHASQEDALTRRHRSRWAMLADSILRVKCSVTGPVWMSALMLHVGHGLMAAATSLRLAAGLTEIQRSAVDMLVLTRCRRFVGFAASSLSSFVMFFRTQNGFSAETNSFVGRSYMMGVVTLLGDIIAT